MKFVKENENINRYVDTIFTVVNAAKADPEGLNATAGCLYDESGKLLTFKCVYDTEKSITPIQKASYADSPAGNNSDVAAVNDFVREDKVINRREKITSP